MNALNFSVSKGPVQIWVLPGSARIKVTFPTGDDAMFDPISLKWHPAGQDQPSPTSLLRRWGVHQRRLLEEKLLAFHAERRRIFRSSRGRSRA